MNAPTNQTNCAVLKSFQDCLDLFLKACFAPADTLTGWSLDDRNPEAIAQMMPFFGWVYQHYFRVETDGWENMPSEGKALLIGSHNGGLAAPDTVMMTYDIFRFYGTERLAYALMDPKIWQLFPGLARLATQVGTIQPHPRMAREALRRGAALLIYPGGVKDVFRPHSMRNRIYFHGHKGFIRLALEEQAPIIPFISHGAHSTLIVLTDIYPQLQELQRFGFRWIADFDPVVFPIYLGLPWGIGFGPLPNIPFPVKLHTRVCPPIIFERYGHDAASDRHYVNQCYHQVCREMQQQLDRLFTEQERGLVRNCLDKVF